MSIDAITLLQDKINSARKLAQIDLARLQNEPNNLMLQLSSGSMHAHIDDLEQQLRLAQAERAKEIFELRLVGERTRRGDIPLPMLASLAGPLNQLISGAAHWLRFATTRSVGEDWERTLDLRLGGMAPGSTKLFFSANVTPDLAGDSPTQDALHSIFSVLNAGMDTFFDKLDDIGPRASHALLDLVKELEKDNTSVELKWYSPANELLSWEGRLDRITQIRSILESTSQPEESNETIIGTITLLATTGRLEVVPTGETHPVKIRYPKAKPELVAGLTLNQQVTLNVIASTQHDPVRQTDVTKYRLLDRIPSTT